MPLFKSNKDKSKAITKEISWRTKFIDFMYSHNNHQIKIDPLELSQCPYIIAGQ
jgi:hypothetical protein